MRVSWLTTGPMAASRRAPGRPPRAKASAVSSVPRRAVRRPCGGTNAGKRAVKMRRAPSAASQHQRRVCRRIRTAKPCHGRSPSRCRYRRCTRVVGAPQSGQHALVRRARTTMVTPASSATNSANSRLSASGSRVGMATSGAASRGTGGAILPQVLPARGAAAPVRRLPARRHQKRLDFGLFTPRSTRRRQGRRGGGPVNRPRPLRSWGLAYSPGR